MARDLFIDLTNRRLVASETNSAPVGLATFTKGDTGAFNLYFLEATGVINRPFEVVDKSSTSVKLGIGSRTGVPETGTYTLSFFNLGLQTTAAIPAAATAGQVESALNAISTISNAGGVTVDGSVESHFTVRFNNAGSRASIAADVTQLIPDTVAVIDERIAGSASVKEVQEIQLRLTPAVYQDSWTDLGTAVTATIETTITGSDTDNEVQRLSFSREPFSGSYRLAFPSTAFTVDSAVTSGLFVTTVTHGLALNQPVTITGFDTVITGYTRGATLFVRTIPEVNQFTLAVTAGGTVITGEATTTTTAGTVTTIARQTAPISATASAADVQAALQALDSIGAGGVIVTGIPGQFFDVTFSGAKGQADQPELTVQNGTTAKPGKTADVNFATFALRDLLGNNPAVDLDLELELTESGTRQTVILQACSVAEELIDADSFSPTSGYPSFIFQALTDAATNATTSLVPITGLNWTAQANSEYLVSYSPDAAFIGQGAIEGQMQSPEGSTIYGRWIIYDPDNATLAVSTPLSDRQAFYGEGSVNINCFQRAYIKTGATAGVVSFEYAASSVVTDGFAEIGEGSWVRVEKVK
jgi:hypothetical protein